MNFQDPNRWAALGQQLTGLAPELWLIAGMCAVLLTPFLRRHRFTLPTMAAVGCLLAAVVFTLGTLTREAGTPGAIFSGMFVIDPFSQFFKVMLFLFALLVLTQWMLLSRSKTHELDVPDYLCLFLGAVTGMAMMSSAANLLMIFMAIESASLPSYVLAGFRKRSRLASEGSLKYVIFGSAASAIMLYGMSLIYGMTGSLGLTEIAQYMAGNGVSPLLAVGMLAMLAGLAFKLSAVPMHFWSPDVFHGAPLEIATFLSVASKGAAVCLLVRVLQTLSAAHTVTPEYAVAIMGAVGLLGAVTATWGNLVALRQYNMRRLLAYSSIAHAGYLIMTASVIIMAADKEPAQQRAIAGAILFYLLVYMFMNLGAFTVAGLVFAREGTDDVRQYAGLLKRNPVMAVLMMVFLLSLFGMPGLGGFMGKIFIASQMFTVGSLGFVLVAVLLVNTLLSLFFYLRPIYYMLVAPDENKKPAYVLSAPAMVILSLCGFMLIWTGVLPGSLSRLANDFGRIQTHATPVTQTTPSNDHPQPAVVSQEPRHPSSSTQQLSALVIRPEIDHE